MDINMEYFKVFYYVAKYGSISAAARELHISQPAVSQALKNFEAEIGGSVFIRNSKGVTLTQEGQSLFYYISKGYEQMEIGVRKFEELKNLEGGTIRIGASDMTLRFFILPYLEKFCEEYPKIKISVTNAQTPKTIANLTQGAIDFGVVSTPVITSERLTVQPVREIQDIFVVGEKYKALAKTKQEYGILEEYPYICLDGKTSSKSYVDSYLTKQGIKLVPEFSLATSDMVLSFAKRGFGIASVVRDFAQESIDKGELFEVEFISRIENRQFAVVYDERQSMSIAAKQLLNSMNVMI